MQPGRVQLRMIPEHSGSNTRGRLEGSVPTAVPRATATRVMRGLAFWSGWLVRCVLSVDKEAASWCEWWTDSLAGTPAHLLKQRYDIGRADPQQRDR
jgi:hypothetical protein